MNCIEVIGMDRDGVMTPLDKFQKEEGIKFFNKIPFIKMKKTPDFTKYDFQDIFGCNKLVRNFFWACNLKKYFIDLSPLPGVKNFIDGCHEKGIKVVNPTAGYKLSEKGFLGIMFRLFYKIWLKKHQINFDAIDFCSEKYSARDKVISCRKHHVSLMIEDRKDIIEVLEKNNIPTICYSAFYNQDTESSYYASNYDEVTKAVDEINKKLIDLRAEKNFYVDGKFKKMGNEAVKKLSFEDYKLYKKELMKIKLEKMTCIYEDEKIKEEEKRFRILYRVIVPLFNMITSPKVINKDNLPYQDGVIYIATHTNSIEQFPAMAAIGNKPLHFLIANKLLKQFRGVLYNYVGAIPIDRQNGMDALRGLKEAITLIKKNRNVFIYVEGTRNQDPRKFMLPIKSGSLLLAQITGAPIVPLSVNGEYKFRGNNLFNNIGEVFFIEPWETEEEAIKKMFEALAKLKIENLKRLNSPLLESQEVKKLKLN